MIVDELSGRSVAIEMQSPSDNRVRLPEAMVDEVLSASAPYVIFDDQPSVKQLLIVFAYIDQRIGTRSHSTFLSGVEARKIFINPGCNHWYQTGVPGLAKDYAGLLAFATAVRRRFHDHETLCLGHSMGAFAALGIGVAIGADRVLASVPEILLNTPGSISARCLGGVSIQHGNLVPLLQENRKTRISVIVGRKTRFDMAVATKMADMPLVETVGIDSDHATFPYLRDQGKLAGLMRAFVKGEPVAKYLVECCGGEMIAGSVPEHRLSQSSCVSG